MNATERLRLTSAEANTILMGCAYQLSMLTIDYNKSKLVAQALGSMPAQPAANPNAETSTQDKAKTASRDRLEIALNEIHNTCKSDLANNPAKIKLGILIQTKLLPCMDSKINVSSLDFSKEECDFIISGLRCFERAEVISGDIEVVLASFIRMTDNYDNRIGQAISESSRKTEADWKAADEIRNDFTCLMAKVLNYSKAITATVNDQ